ncbi:MAG TPA: hypothetical protein VMM12_05475 [Longimicrobiales bacterium]|nr:hypothetical protein [Longimicrobiales bacterium]
MGAASLVLLALVVGWGQDAAYERDIRDFRTAVWELQAAVATGLTRDEYRDLLRAARVKQLKARAELFHWDIRRESWGLLNRTLTRYEEAATAWDRKDNSLSGGTAYQAADSLRQASWTQAGESLHAADFTRRTWWWADLPGSGESVFEGYRAQR